MNAPESIANPATLLKNPALFRQDALINGQWIKASANQRFPVRNPATGQNLALVANLNTADAHEAIQAADIALPAWRGKVAKERAGIMRKWFELILANADDLA
ncbi:MAG: aldehyde dehydrogenase family protein, partial [Burkholderiaceae bacterium]|nr:aldehyde dehydrogenase family protein [Burkholderiaceae bacterium]